MRLQASLLSLLAITGIANAQYFSAGWTPGQPVPTEPATTAPPTSSWSQVAQNADSNRANTFSSFLDELVTAGPVSAIMSFAGLNISGTRNLDWDERIPLITDSNYQDIIVNEELSPEEEEKRVWFLIITVTAGQPEGISKYVDTVFDDAYNHTLEKGDLPHVRFGRIDYLDVTSITTKWAVWSAPTLVVLRDRGRTLRFYKGGRMHLTAELLYQFLKDETWRMKEPWNTAFSPGGQREWVLDYLALVLSTVHSFFVRVPRWVMYVASGGAASLIINLLHKSSPQRPAVRSAPKPSASSAPIATKGESTATSGKVQKSASKRKGKQ
ncbi:hypothetical protein M404DRAFT_123436 [Pisolithus tinctorius Marx 270]|uniref:Thioredoxin domain-containing protein n=1 Tax=Pisolithus tinctorius Marx 270 TaxID=870435 RepID=A0A0C3KSB9_PISTI|nr:hypothetical protein M404DRAFT_123436 [Pisolithus tinctorius Marx 270]